MRRKTASKKDADVSKKNKQIKMRYATLPWPKESIVKTYSRSRPWQANQQQNGSNYEGIFHEAPKKVEANEAPFQIVEGFETEVGGENFKENENVNLHHKDDSEKTNADKVSLSDNRNIYHEDSPKNSTCLEGGAKINNTLIGGPMLSPIPATEKTSYDVLSMELTEPCIIEKKKIESTNCLSTIGGASPYILAALSKTKKKKTKKYALMSFIRERAKEKRLTLPKDDLAEQPPSRAGTITKRRHVKKLLNPPMKANNVDEASGSLLKTKMHLPSNPTSKAEDTDSIEMAMEEKGTSQEIIVPESDCESVHANVKLVDSSPIILMKSPRISVERTLLEKDEPDAGAARSTKEESFKKKDELAKEAIFHLKNTPKSMVREGDEITPEDKNSSFEQSKTKGSVKIRRSLCFPNPKVPADILLTFPADESYATVRRSLRSRHGNASKQPGVNRYPIDILFL